MAQPKKSKHSASIPGFVTGEGGQQLSSLKKVAVIMLPILLLGISGYSIVRWRISGTNQCQNKTSPLYKESAKALKGSLAEQKKVAGKIVKNDAYTQDPNCLYPLLSYAINASDTTKAKLYSDYFTSEIKKRPENYRLYKGYSENDPKKVQADAQNYLKRQSDFSHSYIGF